MKKFIFYAVFLLLSCATTEVAKHSIAGKFIQLVQGFSLDNYTCDNGPIVATVEFQRLERYYSLNREEISSSIKRKYLALVFLRVYNWHLSCFDQSFDLKYAAVADI